MSAKWAVFLGASSALVISTLSFGVGVVAQNKYALRQRVSAYLAGVDYYEIERDQSTKQKLVHFKHSPVPCPAVEDALVLVVMGQSNAGNYVTERKTSPGSARTYYNGRCYNATDPLPGASGDRGSVWTRLATELQSQHSTKAILIVPIAVADTTVDLWAPDGLLNSIFEYRLDQLARSGYKRWIGIVQIGESDGGRNTGPESFARDLGYLVSRLRQNGEVYVALTSGCGIQKNEQIRAAQREVIMMTGARTGIDMDAIGPRYRANVCHLNPEGASLIADRWAHLLQTTFIAS